jgi:hypothetical protein
MFRRISQGIIAVAVPLFAVGCSQSGNSPVAPSASTSRPFGSNVASSGLAQTAEQPPFNLEVILGGDGFGLVKFRQAKDSMQSIVTLDTSVRDLQPNTSYSLQRAVDTVIDGTCTNASLWLTLGEGLTAHPIVTDDTGRGRADLWRDLSSFTPGSTFDIDFRVVDNTTGAVVLQSGCYRFVVRD